MNFLKHLINVKVRLNFHSNNDCVDESDYTKAINDKIRNTVRKVLIDVLTEYVESDCEVLTGYNIDIDEEY